MAILDNVLSKFGYISEKQFTRRVEEAVKTELVKNLPYFLGETADAMRFNMPDPSVYANQSDLYRLSPILGTAVELLSNDVATAQFNVKRRVGEEVRDIPNHDFEILIRNPNPADSGLEFLANTVSSYKLNGNAVWWLNRESQYDVPEEIWPLPFSMLSPVPDKRMYIDHYDYFPGNGRTIQLKTWQLVHFRTFNPNNRFIGLSMIESLAVTLSGDQGMRRTNTVTYNDHNGAPPSIIAFKDWIGDPQWEDTKKEIRDSAAKNRVMTLRGVGDGVSWLQRQISSKDMEYVANLQENLTTVFNRACPGLLAMLEPSATEANALAARATYAEKTLWPTMEAIAQKVTSDILPAYGRKLIGVFTDPRVVDKKINLEEQAAFERTHTIEEVRKEYYQDEPIGDERDKLLPVQVNAQSGGIQKPPEPKIPQQPQQIQDNAKIENNNPQVKKPTDEEANNPQDAATQDLAKMERKAVKRVGKAIDFASENIPYDLMESIKSELPRCKVEADTRAVFARARQNLNPARKSEVLELAAAINRLADKGPSITVVNEGEAYKRQEPQVLHVHMPEQAAPQVYNWHEAQKPANVDVHADIHVPEQPVPNVSVNVPPQPTPNVEVHVPQQQANVVVNVPKVRRTRQTVKRDEGGNISGSTTENEYEGE